RVMPIERPLLGAGAAEAHPHRVPLGDEFVHVVATIGERGSGRLLGSAGCYAVVAQVLEALAPLLVAGAAVILRRPRGFRARDDELVAIRLRDRRRRLQSGDPCIAALALVGDGGHDQLAILAL